MDILTRAVPALTTSIPEETDISGTRARLPLLAAVDRRLNREQEAIAEFGLAYTWAEIRPHLLTYLPRQLFKSRGVWCQRIELYQQDIPDAALAAWDRAEQSGYFREFCIATPSYRDQSAHARVDPWLIGWLGAKKEAHTVFSHWNQGRGIILAYWE